MSGWIVSKRTSSLEIELSPIQNGVVAWARVRRGMRFLPETFRDLQGIHPLAFPPCTFIAGLVQLSMMPPAERHGELITHLEADGPRLGKPQVMGIRWLPATDKAWL